MIKEKFDDFVRDLTGFSSSDILVHIHEKLKSIYYFREYTVDENLSNFLIKVSFESSINQIVKIANSNLKTYDIKTISLVNYVLNWQYKGKEITTPIFITPCDYVLNKIEKQFEFHTDLTNSILNPFLIKSFKEDFDIEISNCLIYNREEEIITFKNLLEKCNLNFKIDKTLVIGNFHYHRYELLKDIEEINNNKSYGDLILTILGEGKKNEKEIELNDKNCFPCDIDQKKVFELLKKESCVVQGPPGTGKSLMISNLISKLIFKGGEHLMASEKKTALHVILQNLKKKNLDNFCFELTSHTKNSDFIRHLKKSWNFIENYNISSRNLYLSDNYISELQLFINRIYKQQILKDYSIQFLSNLENRINTDKIKLIVLNLDYEKWKSLEIIVQQIYSTCNDPKYLSVLNTHEYFNIDNIVKTKNLIDLINCELEFKSINDIDNYLKKIARIQLIENEESKKYFYLLNNVKSKEKYYKLVKKFEKNKLQLEEKRKECSNWQTIPTKTEIDSWKEIIQSKKILKKHLLKKKIKTFLTKSVEIEIAIKHMELYLVLLEKKQEILSEFIDLGIENPELNLTFINYLLNKIEENDPNEINYLLKLSQTERKRLVKYNHELSQLKADLKANYHLQNIKNIPEIFEDIVKNIPKIIDVMPLLKKLPKDFILLFSVAINFEEYKNLVLSHNWVKIKSMYFDFKNMDGDSFKTKIDQILTLKKEEETFFSHEIISRKKDEFLQYQKILNTDLNKLTSIEKEIKKKLKKGKSILVKEFSKSKQHKSVRELMNSEAEIWINLLCPIFLSTPVMVSKSFSLDKKFDIILFDEASQISLIRSIPILQRGIRALFVGDEQQMSPINYFNTNKNNTSILHQASYYFKNIMLTHHYRSEHAQLIDFSNNYFYENKLLVYPSPKNENPIEICYQKDGVFENRSNINEAKALVKKLDELLDKNKSLGIVTFSEQQVITIWKLLTNLQKEKCLEKQQNNQFFLKTLEQVQGEECDILMVSFAYGKNESGEFHKRFGPLNHVNGIKRLNVLFSRAKSKIFFFTSIKATDLELSNNNAVNLLKSFLYKNENQNFVGNKNLPYNIINQAKKENELKINQIYNYTSNIEEIVTFHQVIENRGWNIKYVL